MAQTNRKLTAGEIAIIFGLILVLVLSWFFLGGKIMEETKIQINPQTIQEQFIDMDGDGKVDFVIEADVIYNRTDFQNGQ